MRLASDWSVIVSDWVKNLKVGDKVFVDGVGISGEVRIRTVERITKTLVCLSGGDRIKVSDGQIYGAPRWSRSRVALLNDDALRLKWARQRAAHAIRAVKVESLSEVQCRDLHDYIAKLTEDTKETRSE